MFFATNWVNVWQSVHDIWLPTFLWIAAIIAVFVIVKVVQNKKGKN